MKTHTITTTTYAFAELSEEAQQTALDKLRDLSVSDLDWWEFVYEDAKTCAAIFGLGISRIYFSGFSSQGDGACLEGSYRYKAGAAAAIREHAPLAAELHRIADALQTVQRSAFYGLTATSKHRGHYYHEMCTEIDVDTSREYARVTAEQEEAVKEALRDVMRWIYRRLEKEYEYLTSDAQVRECIEANEYEFTEDGSIY